MREHNVFSHLSVLSFSRSIGIKLLLLLFLLSGGLLFGAEVELNNGQKLRGDIVRKTDKELVLKIFLGSYMDKTIQRSDIKSIRGFEIKPEKTKAANTEISPFSAKGKSFLFLLAGGHHLAPDAHSVIEAARKKLPDGEISFVTGYASDKRSTFDDWRTAGASGPSLTKLIEKARSKMDKRRPDGVVLIWRHSTRGMASKDYVSRFTEMISALRDDLKRPDLGVVIGINKAGGSNELSEEPAISGSSGRVAWVDASDTLAHHVTGLVEMSERYAEQAAALATGQPLPPPRATLPPPLPAKTGGPLRFFIMAGQSNMFALNPEENFIPLIRKALPNDELLGVRDTAGGLPISRWYDKVPSASKAPASSAPDTASQAAQPAEAMTPAYQSLLKRIRETLGTRRPESIVFLWMQGETEGLDKNMSSSYYAFRLRGLVAALRNDLQRPDMKVVIGRISDMRNAVPWNTVREAQVTFAEQDGQAAWVNTDDLNDMFDENERSWNDLHYPAAGYMKLGQRFAEQALKLMAAPKKP